eukprot:CAMPEP_0178990444 /NCGR_PEP_ID=MMETSP0795-20121207/4951_1 /TAXON_ID=88552 /ORGANISM="Amoebophrya sp., Strain Ameob2" /LENGTH=55 /DNA_ID=CAMNT_0020681993 /DNA_START=438 /DNA_END=602 /DNA_ORIENTATION=-
MAMLLMLSSALQVGRAKAHGKILLLAIRVVARMLPGIPSHLAGRGRRAASDAISS